MRQKADKQAKAKKLRAQGKSLNEIIRLLGVSKSSVSVWVRNVPLTKTQQDTLKQKELSGAEKGRKALGVYWKKYQAENPKPVKHLRWPVRQAENFFDEWTPEMAYVLGYFAADGTMYKNKRGSCYIGFTSTDRELVETVKRLVGVSNAIEEYQPKPSNSKKRYTLQVGSKKIYKRLIALGFTPNKSLTIRLPNIPDNVLGHFVRGNLDGDGCVYTRVYKRMDRSGVTRVCSVRFCSGSKRFIGALQKKIEEVTHIGGGVMQIRSANYYVLGYGIGSARQLYDFMYPMSTVPHLRRKKRKFEEFFNL